MADVLKSKKPVRHPKSEPPETHAQTKPLERKIRPQENTTEAYGTSDADAAKKTGK